jgi:excisionase family DNA binding protein
MTNTQPAVSRPEWLTAAEVAAHLKVQTRTVLLWTRQGKIKAYALSGTKRRVWRYLRSDVDSLLFGNPVVSSESLSVLSDRRSK